MTCPCPHFLWSGSSRSKTRLPLVSVNPRISFRMDRYSTRATLFDMIRNDFFLFIDPQLAGHDSRNYYIKSPEKNPLGQKNLEGEIKACLSPLSHAIRVEVGEPPTLRCLASIPIHWLRTTGPQHAPGRL